MRSRACASTPSPRFEARIGLVRCRPARSGRSLLEQCVLRNAFFGNAFFGDAFFGDAFSATLACSLGSCSFFSYAELTTLFDQAFRLCGAPQPALGTG